MTSLIKWHLVQGVSTILKIHVKVDPSNASKENVINKDEGIVQILIHTFDV